MKKQNKNMNERASEWMNEKCQSKMISPHVEIITLTKQLVYKFYVCYT